MAAVFEKRLVQDLGYNCPWKMRELINLLDSSSQVKVFFNSTNFNRYQNIKFGELLILDVALVCVADYFLI